MPADDHLIDDVADAILDGTPIDWAAVEAHVDGQSRPLLDRLRMLAAFADAHRDPPHAAPTCNEDPDAPRAGGASVTRR